MDSGPDEVTEISSIYFIKALGITQHVTDMRTRSRKKMFLGSRAQPACKADNFTALCEPTV
jgi:sulfur transfer protein SufE